VVAVEFGPGQPGRRGCRRALWPRLISRLCRG
jgi:hypothetical protein